MIYVPVKEVPGYILETVAVLAINEFLDAPCKSSLWIFFLLVMKLIVRGLRKCVAMEQFQMCTTYSCSLIVFKIFMFLPFFYSFLI